jgi:flagellar hook-associated protein 3 FlgL
MMPLLDAANQQLLNSMNITQRDLNRAQNEVSSGLRINRASDDPTAINDLLATRSELAGYTQTQKNLTEVQAEVQAADSGVQNALQALDTARSLAAQGANTTLTASDRAGLADQVSGIIAQLVSISRTEVNGVYIFSGDQTTTPPYELDSSSPNGVNQLVTASSTRLIQDATGLTFASSKTAAQLFGNVFDVLGNLRNALLSNDPSAVQATAAALAAAQQTLNEQGGAFYGMVLNRVSTALDLANKFETQAQGNLSHEQDADVAAEALQITQDTTHLNASMASAAKQRTTSLFDYLPPS